jgi:hypothetical protein
MTTRDETRRKEYERRADECFDFAHQTTSPKIRESFVALAETWAKLANDMATSASQLKRMK